MKLGKIFVVTTLAVSLLTTSLAFAGTQKSTKGDTSSTVTAQQSKISWSKAKSIFKTKVPGSYLKYMRLTVEDGYDVYMGKATKGSTVYSFEINAYTGRIRDLDRDYEGSRSTASKIGSSFTKAEAQAKALRKVPKAKVIYVKLTRDDGRWVYEGELYRNGYEYTFEMNAFSGNIIEWEKDWAFS